MNAQKPKMDVEQFVESLLLVLREKKDFISADAYAMYPISYGVLDDLLTMALKNEHKPAQTYDPRYPRDVFRTPTLRPERSRLEDAG